MKNNRKDAKSAKNSWEKLGVLRVFAVKLLIPAPVFHGGVRRKSEATASDAGVIQDCDRKLRISSPFGRRYLRDAHPAGEMERRSLPAADRRGNPERLLAGEEVGDGDGNPIKSGKSLLRGKGQLGVGKIKIAIAMRRFTKRA
ncbi:MAG: hypothetical protein JW929_16680 [Anaerolineales bacterium]|nr:hypothetical protein [Anaerolineales bacterium]